MTFPSKAAVDRLKQHWSDKLVRVKPGARPELERLLDTEPGRADYWACYGIVLSGLGRTADARAALELAKAAAPADPRIAKLLARVGEPDAFARAMQEDWDALVVK